MKTTAEQMLRQCINGESNWRKRIDRMEKAMRDSGAKVTKVQDSFLIETDNLEELLELFYGNANWNNR